MWLYMNPNNTTVLIFSKFRLAVYPVLCDYSLMVALLCVAVPTAGNKGFFRRYVREFLCVNVYYECVCVSTHNVFFYCSPFKALEDKLVGGVTVNHLAWAALGGGMYSQHKHRPRARVTHRNVVFFNANSNCSSGYI